MSSYHLDISNYHSKTIKYSDYFQKATSIHGEEININNYYVERNGTPFFVVAGEFHYSRYPYTEWETELIKMKLTGVNVISTYVFWIYHEEEEGQYDFNGSNNLHLFLKLCHKHELLVILRIGPYCHGEVRNGGLPDWLYGRFFEVRSNDPEYLSHVRRLYTKIGEQAKGHLFREGGPIVGIQLENEYLHAASPWEMTLSHGVESTGIGNADVTHINILKDIAVEVGLIVPFYTMTGWDSNLLEGMSVLPMIGGYAYRPWYNNADGDAKLLSNNYLFVDRHKDNDIFPVTYCELMGGMQCWYQSRFIVEPESVSAIAINALAGGSNFIGYYMYHGGNNQVGKRSFLNENTTPKIDYDFQAPIGSFGQVRPSADFLRPLHYFMTSFVNELVTMGTYVPENAVTDPMDTKYLRYAARTNGQNGFVFLNNYQDHWKMEEHKDIKLHIKGKGEIIKFPQKTVLHLKEKVSCIMPINLQMEEVLLKYSTAQPITYLDDPEGRVYFFFTPKGIEAEYCFNNVKSVQIDHGMVIQEEATVIVKADTNRSIITVESTSGNRIRICTLSNEEAHKFWIYEFWGKKRAIITDMKPVVVEDNVSFVLKGTCNGSFSVFPPVSEELKLADHQAGHLKLTSTSLFEQYDVSTEHKTLLSQEHTRGPKGLVEIVDTDFHGLNNLWLHVEYEGDVAKAFIGGKLVCDHFYNETVWEIGLKQFRQELANNPMNLHISPRKEGTYIVKESAMALQQEFVGEIKGKINSITLIPEYQITICIN